MKSKRITVTGGSGDLGKVLGPRLLSLGASVASLDPERSNQPGIESIEGSILDRPLVDEVIAESDLVIHIAAWHGYHAFTGSKTSEEFWDLNMTGTFNLLEACARRGKKKIVFISSTSVDEWPDMYGMTKSLGEDLCRAYAARHGMQILALRPRAFIPWWNTKVYASKTEWASWFARGAVHIEDVATGVVLACERLLSLDTPLFDSIELDGRHDFSESEKDLWRKEGAKSFLTRRFQQFAQTIERATYLPSDPPSYKDLTKAQAIIGYMPRYGYEEMLAELSGAAPG